jgi:two-component system, response regulator, stage 0 sporulation protein F
MSVILLVDDDKNLRRLYKAELEAEGYQVILAENGRQALELAEAKSPDLVIMDIRMPEMDGLETMARMLQERRNVPVILNSAYSSFQDNFLTWAAEGYIIKSADLSPLKEKIRDTLRV